MRISDWSSDVCSSDLANLRPDIVSFIAELNVLQPYCTSDDAKTLACLDSPTKTFPQGTSGAPCARPRRRSRASAPIDAGPRFTTEDAADKSTAGIMVIPSTNKMLQLVSISRLRLDTAANVFTGNH